MWKNNKTIKVLAILTLICFLGQEMSFASECARSHLAPETQVDNKVLKENFLAKTLLLAHEAVNKYIREQIGKEKMAFGRLKKRDVYTSDLAARGNIKLNIPGFEKIILVSITGLLKNTGQPAHVGLSGKEYEGIPVVYIDSRLYNDPAGAVIKHEMDEHLQWENLCVNVLGFTRPAMRQWIKDHISTPDSRLNDTEYEGLTSKDIAKQFHINSYSLDSFYDKHKQFDLNYDYIRCLLNIPGYEESDTGDVNIAANGGAPVSYQIMDDIELHERRPRDLDYGLARTVIARNSKIARTKLQNTLKRENWWFNDYWRNKGIPQEQISIVVNGHPIDIYNWSDTKISQDQLLEIKNVLSVFSNIADGKTLEKCRYLLIDNESKISPYDGNEQNGADDQIGAIHLYPRVLDQTIPHRVEIAARKKGQDISISNLEGTLIHEFSHKFIESDLRNIWSPKFRWKGTTGVKKLRGGFPVTEELSPEDEKRCITSYATLAHNEDICESMVAAIKTPDALDPERLNFLNDRYNLTVLSKKPISESKFIIKKLIQDQIILPRIMSPLRFRVKKPEKLPFSFTLVSEDKGSPAHLLEKIIETSSIFKKMIQGEGITVNEAISHRNYSPSTVYLEFEILKELGIFVPAELPAHYKFSNMMVNTNHDEEYTTQVITAINKLEYQVGKKGKKQPLQRRDIPKDKRPIVKQLVRNITVRIKTENKQQEAVENLRKIFGGNIVQNELDLNGDFQAFAEAKRRETVTIGNEGAKVDIDWSPSQLTLTPLFTCNANCPHCMFADKLKEKKILTEKDIEKILDSELFPDDPYIHIAGGEVLLMENLTDLVEKFPIFGITTNASKMDTLDIARNFLSKLRDAHGDRRAGLVRKGLNRSSFNITISMDDLHLKQPAISVEKIANLIEASMDYSSTFYLTIILSKDHWRGKAFPSLKEELLKHNISIEIIEKFRKFLITRDHQKLHIDCKQNSIARVGGALSLPDENFDEDNIPDFTFAALQSMDSFGKMYNGEYSYANIGPKGSVTINDLFLAGHSPLIFGNLLNGKETWTDMLTRLNTDPLFRALEQSSDTINDIIGFAEEYHPGIVGDILDGRPGDLSAFTYWLFSNPERKLYITCRLLDEYYENGTLEGTNPFKGMTTGNLKIFVINQVSGMRKEFRKKLAQKEADSVILKDAVEELKRGRELVTYEGNMELGQLVEFEADKLFVIGDLHTDMKAFDAIYDQIENELNSGAKVVILGDALATLHSEDYKRTGSPAGEYWDEYLKDIDKITYQLLMKIAKLKIKYKDNFHILVGNNELSFMGKAGTDDFRRGLKEMGMLEEVKEFVDALPLFAVGKIGGDKYLFSHGGVQRKFASRDTLISLKRYGLTDEEKTPKGPDINSIDEKYFDIYSYAKNPDKVNFFEEQSPEYAGQFSGHIHLFGRLHDTEQKNFLLNTQTVNNAQIAYAKTQDGRMHIIDSYEYNERYVYLEVTESGVKIHNIYVPQEKAKKIFTDKFKDIIDKNTKEITAFELLIKTLHVIHRDMTNTALRAFMIEKLHDLIDIVESTDSDTEFPKNNPAYIALINIVKEWPKQDSHLHISNSLTAEFISAQFREKESDEQAAIGSKVLDILYKGIRKVNITGLSREKIEEKGLEWDKVSGILIDKKWAKRLKKKDTGETIETKVGLRPKLNEWVKEVKDKLAESFSEEDSQKILSIVEDLQDQKRAIKQLIKAWESKKSNDPKEKKESNEQFIKDFGNPEKLRKHITVEKDGPAFYRMDLRDIWIQTYKDLENAAEHVATEAFNDGVVNFDLRFNPYKVKLPWQKYLSSAEKEKDLSKEEHEEERMEAIMRKVIKTMAKGLERAEDKVKMKTGITYKAGMLFSFNCRIGSKFGEDAKDLPKIVKVLGALKKSESEKSSSRMIGIDISGIGATEDIRTQNIITALKAAKEESNGLITTFHFDTVRIRHIEASKTPIKGVKTWGYEKILQMIKYATNYINAANQSALMDRIGHGLPFGPRDKGFKETKTLEGLREVIRDKHIPIESCPSANLKTHKIAKYQEHPFHYWAANGFTLSLGLDGADYWPATLSEEVVRLFLSSHGSKCEDIKLSQLKDIATKEVSTEEDEDIEPVEKTPLDKEIDNNNMDIDKALVLLDNIPSAQLKTPRYYEIRYDKARLQEYELKYDIHPDFSPAKLLEDYVNLLKVRAKDPNDVDFVEYSGPDLISVKCYADKQEHKLVGEGNVNTEANLDGQLLRIIGMLNMAFAASNIRENTPYDKMDSLELKYMSFIREQYQILTGIDLSKQSAMEVFKALRDLPPMLPLPTNELAEYYHLTIRQLEQAA